MKKLKFIKKVISLVCVLTVLVMTLPIGSYVSAGTGVYLGISAPSNYNPKAGGTVTFTLSYTGDVYDIYLSAGTIALNGFTANKAISGTGNTRTLTLSNIQGVGSGKTVSVTGGTGMSSTGNLSNAVTSSAFTINVATPADTIAPVLTLSGPSVNSIYAGETVKFTATYTDNVGVIDIYLTAGTIALNGFTANVGISGTGNTRTITLTNVQGAVGDKSISITGGTGMDAAGNLSNAAKSSIFKLAQKTVVATDKIAPVLTLTGPSANSIKVGQTVTYIATYTDNVGVADIYLTTGTIALNGFTANVGISGTGNQRTITLTNVQGAVGASKYIAITGGTGMDAAGNLSNAAKSLSFSIYKDAVVTETPTTDKPTDWIPNPNTGR